MPTLEVRRHAERADRSDEQSGVSARGRAMCLRLAADAGSFAFVASSARPRAMETARLIAGRLDRVEPALLPDLHGLAFGFWDAIDDLAGYRSLFLRQRGGREIGAEQAALWSAVAATVHGEERALAVSHGAVIELGAIAVADRLGVALDGPVFGYCEGVRVAFASAAPEGIELLRVAAGDVG